MPLMQPNSSPPSEPTPPSGRIRRQALCAMEVLEKVRAAVKEGHPADQSLSRRE